MNRRDSYFWLGLAPYWLRIATAIGTLATVVPGFKYIDRAMVSGTDDWAVQPELWAGLGQVGIGIVILLAGLTLADAARFALDCIDGNRSLHAPSALRGRTEEGAATAPPLPTSRALLETLGITPAPAPAAVATHSQLDR